MVFFDTHIHLSDPEYVSDMKVIITKMEYMKIKACCVSVDCQKFFENFGII